MSYSNNVPVIDPFPRPSADLYGKDADAANAAGWENKWGDIWVNQSKPGQYLSTADVTNMVGKQQTAMSMSDPNNYNPGVNYMALLAPYLKQSANGSQLTVDQGGTAMPTNTFRDQLTSLASNPDSVANTNAYKFRLNQGQQALERSAASKGMLSSGNTLAALMDYGQGLASTEYGNEFNRLSGAMGQEDSFNLGKANLNVNNRNSLAGLVLDAGKAKSGDYWNAQSMASSNALKSGYISPNIW